MSLIKHVSQFSKYTFHRLKKKEFNKDNSILIRESTKTSLNVKKQNIYS